MSDSEAPIDNEELQFDRVATSAIACSACRESIPNEYYDVNGNVFCHRCRLAIESASETPRGAAPFVTAALCGLGAGVAGAFIYFAVIYFAHLEIGIVAILIGYMVGYTVRKGAGGRGGLRFQVLAVALTYASVAFAYVPIVVISAAKEGRAAQTAATTARPVATASAPDQVRLPRTGLVAVALVLAFIAALPLLVVWSSLPTGLIGAFIIFIGMRQAWRMTGAPHLDVFGPYQVGTASGSGSV